MIKQRRVDSGQIGGVLSIFTQSMFIFGIVTFLNTTALVYQSILKYYISLWGFVIIIVIGLLLWMAIYYVIIMPSMIQFGNRQGYTHGNPMREDIEIIKKELKEIKSELRYRKKNRSKLKHKIRR
jgi:5-bromo-4-chloroindolyl phosphate hydrolysis protein